MSRVIESRLRAELPSRLKQARKRAGLLQDEFAARLGYQLATYRNYEQGTTFPPLPKLLEMAESLDVSVNWLLTGLETGAEAGKGAFAPTPLIMPSGAYLELVTDRKLLERFRPSPEELLALLDESEKEVDLELLDIIGRLRDIRKGKKS